MWPQSWHPGGLGWATARKALAEEVVLVVDASGDAVGFVGLGMDSPEYTVAAATAADVADAVASFLHDAVDGGRHVVFEVPSAATSVWLPALERAGLRSTPAGADRGMRRRSAEPTTVLPDGFSIRNVTAADVDARIEVHRAAWRPADLPYADGRTADPEATSSFDGAAYAAVRDTWLYSEALDLVAVSRDGSFAGCCIGWYDPSTGVAELEPMGVAPAFRGLGLAPAMCDELIARVRRLGGTEVFINTAPRPEYPAPGRAYEKAGFETFDRATTYTLTA